MVAPVPLNPPSIPVNTPSQTQKAILPNTNKLFTNTTPQNSPDINAPVAFPKNTATVNNQSTKLAAVSSKVELDQVTPQSDQIAQFYSNSNNLTNNSIYIGPAISFGDKNTLYGAISRFPMGDNLSLRPSVMFGNGATKISVPVTYEFSLGAPEPFESNPLFTPYVGAGVEYNSKDGNGKLNALAVLGAALNLSEGTALVGEVSSNFNDPIIATVGIGFQY